MAVSRNNTELTAIWKGWHDATGPQMRKLYVEYVKLLNAGYQAADYKDMADAWLSVWETANFTQRMDQLMDELKPLYQELHAYVRRKLRHFYKNQITFPTSRLIPAHLLGNMWAQSWPNVYNLLVPFPNSSIIDATKAMTGKNWTVGRMFNESDRFFTSLGLEPMTPTFWNKSMFVEPKDRTVVCHASAWDFFDRDDFRVKMCTRVNMEDFRTVHHEMGHIQYFQLYQNQSAAFRDGANEGFHEAVGDLMALSVVTPEHLQKVGLLSALPADNQSDINYLMLVALDKIAFLPFGYLIDRYRWDIFSGKKSFEQLNSYWWELRCKHQGVSPPVNRSEDDFDAGAKFHVPNNVPYIRYFVSFVIQFQFHEALCKLINNTKPLHRCDIYEHKAAGKLLRDALSLGSSRPWPEAMEKLTGNPAISAASLLRYFDPLYKFLKQSNEKDGETPGWEDCGQDGPTSPSTAGPSAASSSTSPPASSPASASSTSCARANWALPSLVQLLTLALLLSWRY